MALLGFASGGIVAAHPTVADGAQAEARIVLDDQLFRLQMAKMVTDQNEVVLGPAESLHEKAGGQLLGSSSASLRSSLMRFDSVVTTSR